MNVVVKRSDLLRGETPRTLIFDAFDWESVQEASTLNGRARPHWKGRSLSGEWVFILSDSWTDIEIRDFAQIWMMEPRSFDLTGPESRVLAQRLPTLVSLQDEEIDIREISIPEISPRPS